MDSWITSLRAAVFIYPALVLLTLIPYAVVHYWRSGYMSLTRFVVFYLFLFYLICAFFLTLLPLPEVGPGFCAMHAEQTRPHWLPFYFIFQQMDGDLHTFSFGAMIHSSFFQTAMLNILLTVPFGFFLKYLYEPSFRRALLLIVGLTLLFELSQLTGLFGLYPCPYRVFEVDDLMLNTAGGVFGYWLAAHLHSLPDVHENRQLAPAEVTPVRRFLAFVADLAGAGLTLGLLFGFHSLAFPQDILIELAVLLVWFVLIPLVWRGRTPGKRLLGLRLAGPEGKPAGGSRLLIRHTLLLFLPFLLGAWSWNMRRSFPGEEVYLWGVIAVFLLWLISIPGGVLLSRRHLGLHDLVSGTRNVISRVRSEGSLPDSLP